MSTRIATVARTALTVHFDLSRGYVTLSRDTDTGAMGQAIVMSADEWAELVAQIRSLRGRAVIA